MKVFVNKHGLLLVRPLTKHHVEEKNWNSICGMVTSIYNLLPFSKNVTEKCKIVTKIIKSNVQTWIATFLKGNLDSKFNIIPFQELFRAPAM